MKVVRLRLIGNGQKVYGYNWYLINNFSSYGLSNRNVIIRSNLLDKNGKPYCLVDLHYNCIDCVRQLYSTLCDYALSMIGYTYSFN